MKKIIYLLILGIALSGCATVNPYGSIYNEAIVEGNSTTIIKDGEVKDIHVYVTKYFESMNYRKVLFSDLKEGFMVITKDISIAKAFLIWDPHVYKIILKYTKAGEGKTRIDLVNGTDIPIWARKDVDKDIQQIAKLIEEEK